MGEPEDWESEAIKNLIEGGYIVALLCFALLRGIMKVLKKWEQLFFEETVSFLCDQNRPCRDVARSTFET